MVSPVPGTRVGATLFTITMNSFSIGSKGPSLIEKTEVNSPDFRKVCSSSNVLSGSNTTFSSSIPSFVSSASLVPSPSVSSSHGLVAKIKTSSPSVNPSPSVSLTCESVSQRGYCGMEVPVSSSTLFIPSPSESSGVTTVPVGVQGSVLKIKTSSPSVNPSLSVSLTSESVSRQVGNMSEGIPSSASLIPSPSES